VLNNNFKLALRKQPMQSFKTIFEQYSWEETSNKIYSKTAEDVENALSATKRTLDDFMALISPAAEPYLEQMAHLSRALTLKRFGKTMQLYIPMYLSNECQNICTYCGFSMDNKMARRTLNAADILMEIDHVKQMGYEHILLVTGEAKKTVGMDYFKKVFPIIKPHFSHISMEVQPMDQKDYEELIELGLNTVLVYQETY
jgi:2-iminoacetate synthase